MNLGFHDGSKYFHGFFFSRLPYKKFRIFAIRVLARKTFRIGPSVDSSPSGIPMIPLQYHSFVIFQRIDSFNLTEQGRVRFKESSCNDFNQYSCSLV